MIKKTIMVLVIIVLLTSSVYAQVAGIWETSSAARLKIPRLLSDADATSGTLTLYGDGSFILYEADHGTQRHYTGTYTRLDKKNSYQIFLALDANGIDELNAMLTQWLEDYTADEGAIVSDINLQFASPANLKLTVSKKTNIPKKLKINIKGTVSAILNGAYENKRFRYACAISFSTATSAVHYALGVQMTGTGNGTVAGLGIDCTDDCSVEYPPGTVLTLTATPDPDSTFGGWTGCDSANAEVCTITMNNDRSVTAVFNVSQTPVYYSLTVNKTGSGSGTVTGTGINCGSDCSETYPSGTSATLTANPASGSTFTGWSGCRSSSGSLCTINMDQSKSVTAAFALEVSHVPGPVPSISATDGTYSDRVSLTWTAPSTGGIPTGYKIYRHMSNNSISASEIGTSTETSYNDYVGDTNTYWFWVKAYNGAGIGPFSNGDSGYRMLPPGQVSNLSATDGTLKDKVRVTWKEPTSRVKGYKIYRYTSNNSGLAPELGMTTETFYDDYVGDTNTYWYWVKAFNNAGSGPFSDGDSGYRAGLQPPGAPLKANATDGVYADFIRIWWPAPTTGGVPTGYKIFRHTSSNSSAAAEIGMTTETLYYVDYVGNTNTYWYWVKAYNDAGSSSFSYGDSGHTMYVPGPPISLSATDGSFGNAIILNWVAPTTGGIPDGYYIYRHTSNDPNTSSQIGTSTTTRYYDYVGDSNTYWYWVKAYNDAGSGAFSNSDSGHRVILQ